MGIKQQLSAFDAESELHIWESEEERGNITEQESDELIARFLRTFGGLNDGCKPKQFTR